MLHVFCALGHCRLTQMGVEYVGKLATTIDGHTCQRWDSQTPHEHGAAADPAEFVDDTLPENYCQVCITAEVHTDGDGFTSM